MTMGTVTSAEVDAALAAARAAIVKRAEPGGGTDAEYQDAVAKVTRARELVLAALAANVGTEAQREYLDQLEVALAEWTHDRAEKMDEWRDLLTRMREEARARITAAYAADDWDDEIQRRLAGRHTAAQDAERDRLRARFQALKERFEAMPLDDLLAFDPADDAHWK